MHNLKILSPTDDATINLAIDTLRIKKQAIVFANSKRSAEKAAEDISRKIKESSSGLDGVAEEALHSLTRPTKQCERLAYCLRKGIAFHHAGLVHKQRELIEDNFRKGIIKIICATPTLAFGVDLPAFRAVLKDLRRYGHTGLNWIPTLEYLQMAGRAGRPKFDSYGEAIAIASTDSARDEIWKRYINGDAEEIYSKLAVEPVLRNYILSLIATEFVKDKKQIMDFFSKTFWAYQYKDIEKLDLIISKMLSLLEEFEFIKSSSNEEFISASDTINESYKATALGKRVAELYIDPVTANFIIECLRKSEKVRLNEFSILQMISHTLEIRPLLRVKAKEYEEMQGEAVERNDSLLESEPYVYDPEYDDYLASIKTAMFFNEWIDEKDEEFLLEKFDIRPGEIRVKLDLADWLLYCSTEIARMAGFKEILKEIIKLRLRVQNGVKEELLALIRLEGIGRVRARKMFNARIRTIGDIKKARINILVDILGKKTALSVKEQVGDKEIPNKLEN